MANYLGQQNIKEGLEGHAADWYSDVFDLVFPNLDQQHARHLWKDVLARKEGEAKSATTSSDTVTDLEA